MQETWFNGAVSNGTFPFFGPNQPNPEAVYSKTIEKVDILAQYQASADDADAKIAILIGKRIAPSAARFALQLAQHDSVILAGFPINALVAESDFFPRTTSNAIESGFGGALVRTYALRNESGFLVNDIISPDLDLSDLDDTETFDALSTLLNTWPAKVARDSQATRKTLVDYDPFKNQLVPASPAGSARAKYDHHTWRF